MAAALGEVGAGPSVGDCACLRRELSGEPDAGNLHLRFDEGRVGRAIRRRPLSYSTTEEDATDRRLPHFGAPISRANTDRQINQKGDPTAGSLRPRLQAHSSMRIVQGATCTLRQMLFT